jgi:hypothetical protein
MKTVRTQKSWLKKLSRIAVAVAMVLPSRSGMSQEGASLFSRTPVEGSPSGSASEVVDSNRSGFGMSFRGGHVAGSTVGRNESVTHINLMPYINIDDGLLFGDSRLLRANEGGLAWSFGGGYRHYLADWDVVIGGNSYLDKDQLTGANLQQWGYGAEILSHGWEARGNYYQTFGDSSDQTGSRVDQSSVAFVGTGIQYTRIDSFAEGLKGFDSELGVLLPGEFSEKIDLRAFGGAYHYVGENVEEFTGWSSRVQADVAKWLELGLKVTNDRVFDTTVSFNVAMHFGGFRSQEHTKRSAIQRFAEPVRRNMNVATSESQVAAPGQVATDPGTGLPFVVSHVNSNHVGPFAGTVNNPFNNLGAGLGSGADIVFVHAGSQFNALAPVNLGIGQRLYGEGLITAPTGNRLTENRLTLGGVGDLLLPSSPTFAASNQTLARPTLSASTGNAVNLADDSEFSGFIVSSAVGNGIFGNGASDTLLNDLLVTGSGISGIQLINTSGATTIRNTIVQNSTGPAFHINGGTGRITFSTTGTTQDPSFASITNSSQEALLIENMTAGSVNMTGSTINDTGGRGILIRNNAGNATIDNASIVNSTSTGIAITNSSGSYTFRDSLRTATVVDGATGESVLIDGLAAGGQVTFENMSILNRNDAGIRVNNSAGRADFGVNTVNIGTPGAGAGTDPAVDITNSLATGSVSFARGLSIAGSNGRGLQLTGNAAGSSFTVNGSLAVSGAATDSIAIENDSTTVTVSQRGGVGILVDNSDGSVLFQGANSVSNANAVASSGVVIQNSEAPVGFQSLAVTDVITNPAVQVLNNIAGVNGTALISFANLTVTSTNGEGFQANNNTNIRISDGTITTTGAAAVNIEESGIQVTLEQVNSSGSPDFGIRLVETNKIPDTWNRFLVRGDTQISSGGILLLNGSGGTIDTAGISGVFLRNAGQVRLRQMILDDNQNGIDVRNSGLLLDDSQLLEILSTRIARSDVRGIYSLNLTGLDVRDSVLEDNGDDAALGRETLLAEYNERPNLATTEVVTEFNNPYEIVLLRNTITDNSTDAVVIGSLAAGKDAHLLASISRNVFNLTDTTDPATPLIGPFPVNTFDTDATRDDAIVLRWNGPARTEFLSNTINLSGAGPQTGFDIQTFSTTDQYELVVENNIVDSTVTGTVTGQQIGLRLRTAGLSLSTIDNNNFSFTGGEGRGMELNMAALSEMSIFNNTIIDNTDGGAGIIFNSVAETSSFFISGNQIGLFDTDTGIEEGIVFTSVVGTVNLSGTRNNLVVLGNPGTPGATIERVFLMPAGTSNGQIIVNGVLAP